MYWIEKYSLLRRSQRPKPSSVVLDDAILQLLAFSPCILALGVLTWYNFLNNKYRDFSDMIYVSHLTAAGLALVLFLLPFNSIFEAVCHIPD